MKEVVIVGAGAHCKVVLDVLMQSGEYKPIGLLDSNGSNGILGIPVIGADDRMEELYASGIRYGFVAVGSNSVREKIQAKMEKIGYEMLTLISSHAIVSTYATVEPGTLIMPGAIVNASAHIGRGCILNTNCSVDHDCEIEDFVHIAPGCAISGSTKIGSQSFLGTGSRVIDRISIGKGAMLGAGAVAVRDIPDHCTAVGVPARIKIK